MRSYLSKIIISCNENSTYLENWPVVSLAWQKVFDIVPVLVFITERNPDNQLVKYMQQYGQIALYKPVDGISTVNQAKVIRYYYAGLYENQICMINDIDLIIMQKDYYIKRFNNRRQNELLAIGANVYKNKPKLHGKFPAGYITAEGKIFKEIFNPDGVGYHEFITNLIGIKGIDGKEKIDNVSKNFCDESLTRYLLQNWNGKVRNEPYYDHFGKIGMPAVSRHYPIDKERLRNGEYVEAHHLLPIEQYYDRFKIVCDYLNIPAVTGWIK